MNTIIVVMAMGHYNTLFFQLLLLYYEDELQYNIYCYCITTLQQL